MKPTFLTAAAISAFVVIPALAQQEDAFVPGETFLSNWDADEDGKITLEELKERRAEVFSAFDENEDGKLSAEEFGTYDQTRIESMQRPEGRGNGAGRGEQAVSFAASDANKDGSVSLEEFLEASANWMKVMDRNDDGVVTADDFGAGGQQGGQGQARAKGQGQGMGQGQGQGSGQGQGKGRHGQMQGQQPGYQQGQGRGAGQGRGQGGRWQQGMAPDQQGMQQGQRGGQGRGHGQYKDQQGKGRAQPTVPLAAFPANDGTLWIIDTRTGDILACRTVVDTNAAAGFVPVCLEAAL